MKPNISSIALLLPDILEAAYNISVRLKNNGGFKSLKESFNAYYRSDINSIEDTQYRAELVHKLANILADKKEEDVSNDLFVCTINSGLITAKLLYMVSQGQLSAEDSAVFIAKTTIDELVLVAQQTMDDAKDIFAFIEKHAPKLIAKVIRIALEFLSEEEKQKVLEAIKTIQPQLETVINKMVGILEPNNRVSEDPVIEIEVPTEIEIEVEEPEDVLFE